MIKYLIISIFSIHFICFQLSAQQRLSVDSASFEVKSSLRGIGSYKHKQVALSGSNGMVAFKNIADSAWQWTQIRATPMPDFRSLLWVNDSSILLAAAGSPARIYALNTRTQKATLLFENPDTAWFLDGMAQVGDTVFVLADPVAGRFRMLALALSDSNIHEVAAAGCPTADSGQAAFAASGNTLQAIGNSSLVFATGGVNSGLCWGYPGKGWAKSVSPLQVGKASAGLFGFAKVGRKYVAVGGDYLQPLLNVQNCAVFNGKTWKNTVAMPNGYRSAVVALTAKIWVCTGVSGTDITYNQGKRWYVTGLSGYHTAMYLGGGRVLLAGSKGRYAVLTVR